VELKPGRRRVQVIVSNTGDRPIQVGSHAHFADVNRALAFDRAAARNMLLDIPAGTRYASSRDRAAGGFGRSGRGTAVCMKISREQYARLYGPTTGDRLRLADTELIVEIERDLTGYGDELSFGGGKVIRDAMGQHPRYRAPKVRSIR